jgi:hypothetical protein
VEPESQTDPKFQGRFKYTRMTAKSVRQALIDVKDWEEDRLPHENTIGVLLNRLGYRLRRRQSRGKSATTAADHGVAPEQKLVPFGILDVSAHCPTSAPKRRRPTSRT